jgi:hypothetical protein
MNLLKAMRTTTIGACLLAASGLAVPAVGQVETETVRERVVVTLPNGKRIVRMVDKQVPVAAKEVEAPASDPFAGDGSGDDGIDLPTEDGGGSGGEIDPRIIEWLGWYRSGDMRADANDDGRVTAADFNSYLMLLKDQDGDTKDDGDGSTGGDGSDSGDGTNGGDGSDGGSDDGTNGGDGSDGSTDEIGWTELVPSSDSMIFYVAEIGSDSNDGLSPNRPLRTVAEGVRRLRSGYPDWLLIRRGDTFNEVLSSNWEKSGRSSDEKMVVGAYGDGPRPVLMTGTSKGLSLYRPDRRAHLAFTSLEFRPGVPQQNYGISMVCPNLEDVLFEDLKITGYSHGIALQGEESGQMKDIKIRRTIIADNAGQSRSQGLFLHRIDGVLVEGCIIDRNGWDAALGRDATATIFQHNVYMQRTVKDAVFRNNFTSRAASHGVQLRLGGIVEGNVAWANAAGISFGNEGARSDEPTVQGRINDNLVLEGVHQDSTDLRGWGIQVQHADGVEVMRNIIANSRVGDEHGYGIMLFSNRDAYNANLTIAENVIDDFGRNIRVDEDEVLTVTIRDNLISKSEGSRPLVQHDEGRDVPGLVYEGNRYIHEAQNGAFKVGTSGLTITEWQADFDPQGGPMVSGYNNGDATLDDYARSIGFSGADAFMEAMRNQRKGDWDERLTTSAVREYFKQAFTLRG